VAAGRGQRGIALIAVIWVVALLAAMALDVLAIARQADRTAGDFAARAELDAAADAGLAMAIHELLGAAGGGGRPRGHPEAPPRQASFAGTRLTIRIEDEAGKIDLNEARPALLRALFLALEVPATQADRLAAAIVDWRDVDDFPQPGGAEGADYLRAGQRVPPRDGEFQSVEELGEVLGMTPELLARAAPALTVHGRRAEPDRAMAPALVLRALTIAGGPAPRMPALDPRRAEAEGRAYRVVVLAERADARRLRSAVVRVTGDPADPYWLHSYR
jgi:general secretion pathway protein K